MLRTTVFGFLISTTVGIAAAVVGCSASNPGENTGESAEKVIKNEAGVWVVEPNGCGPGWVYDYLTRSCHQAANNGVDAGNDGIYSCGGATSGPYGHTINWAVPVAGTVCLSEPQIPGSEACCWNDPAAKPGVPPNFSSPAAQACDKKLCGKQYSDGGGVALEAGATWPVAYLDCKGTTASQATCETCCDTNANQIPDVWGPGAITDRENYRKACKASCAPGGGPTPPGPTGPGGGGGHAPPLPPQ